MKPPSLNELYYGRKPGFESSKISYEVKRRSKHRNQKSVIEGNSDRCLFMLFFKFYFLYSVHSLILYILI